LIDFFEFIQEVCSEPLDIGFAEWSQAGCLFSGNHMTFLNELVHDPALIEDVYEDQNVGDQMAVLGDFPLFVAGVRSNDTLVAKGHELNEVVEPFAHGGGMVDDPSEFGFAQVLEQIGAVNDFPKFLEGVKEFILPGTINLK
jgi:hypothetical protein